MKRNSWSKYSNLHLFQFKWNRNHLFRNKSPKLNQIYTTIPAIPALPAIPLSGVEQMEYSSSSTYSRKMLHSIYDSSVPPLPIPKNYQKEYSLRLLLHFIVLRLFVEGRMRHWPRAFHFRYEKSTPRNRLFSKCRCTLGWTLGCFSNFENIDGEYFDLFKYSNCMRSSTLTFLLLSCQPYS